MSSTSNNTFQQEATKRIKEYAIGYPWVFFHWRRNFILSVLMTMFFTFALFAGYRWYVRTATNLWAGSVVGIMIGCAGTLFLLAAAVAYSVQRRVRKSGRKIGRLNNALNWHVSFAIISLVLLSMHSFGQFNPQLSGTYAFYGLITLVASGCIGRILDRVMPRLMAQAVQQSLTIKGDDQLETMRKQVQATSTRNASEARHLSTLFLPLAWSEIRALKREHLYQLVIVWWRKIHLALALVAIALTIWHIVFVIQLFARW